MIITFCGHSNFRAEQDDESKLKVSGYFADSPRNFKSIVNLTLTQTV